VNAYLNIPRIRIQGAPVSMHWSVWIIVAYLLFTWREDPLLGVIGVVCYFTLILLHEAGHAYFARRAGARPIAIRMFLLHGECRYEEPYYAKDDYIIAWGGVLAQLAVAIPLVVLDATMDVTEVYGLPVVVRYLGGMSLLIVAINLLPFPGLDGEKAWRLPKLMYREWRELRKPFRRRKR
jgi:Zn-dependent protease